MISIVEISGKQYCIKPGDKITVARLSDDIDAKIEVKDILNNKTVAAKVVEHKLGDKITTRRFRNKTRYQRTKGHRQPLTVLVFEQVEKAKAKPKKETA